MACEVLPSIHYFSDYFCIAEDGFFHISVHHGRKNDKVFLDLIYTPQSLKELLTLAFTLVDKSDPFSTDLSIGFVSKKCNNGIDISLHRAINVETLTWVPTDLYPKSAERARKEQAAQNIREIINSKSNIIK